MSQTWEPRTDLAREALDPSLCVRCQQPVELKSDARVNLLGVMHESCEIDFWKSVNRGLDHLEDLDTEMLMDWAAEQDEKMMAANGQHLHEWDGLEHRGICFACEYPEPKDRFIHTRDIHDCKVCTVPGCGQFRCEVE